MPLPTTAGVPVMELLVAAAGAVVFFVVASRAYAAIRRKDLHRSALGVGFELAPQTDEGARQYVGRFHEYGVRILAPDEREAAWAAPRLIVEARAELPDGLRIVRRVPLSTLAARTGEDERRTFDPRFDRLVRVDGPELEVAAALSQGIRETLALGVLGEEILLYRDRLEIGSPDLVAGEGRLLFLLERATGLTRDLEQRQAGTADKLAMSAITDQYAGVRRNCLQLLADHFPEDPVTQQAATRSLEDEEYRHRLLAATILGAQANHVVRALVLDANTDEETRGEALTLLASTMPQDELIGLLDELLALPRPDMRVPAIVCLTTLSPPEIGEMLARTFENADERTARELARSVGTGRLTGPAAEEFLLDLLTKGRLAAKRIAAHRLQSVGTARSMPALSELTEVALVDDQLKNEAALALRAIRWRESQVGGGRLSVSETEDSRGDLSFSDPGGDLSLVDDEEPEIDDDE